MIADISNNEFYSEIALSEPKVTRRKRKKSRETQMYSHHIGGMKIKPSEQTRMLLGCFTHGYPPRGFSIHVDPHPQDDAIVSQVSDLDLGDGTYELVLHVANYGSKAVSAEVWQL